MKILKVLTLVLAILAGSWVTHAATGPSGITIEVPIDEVMAPARGYDDNDNVQIVVHGALPNACYNLSRTVYDISDATTIVVKQYAIKKMDGVCAEERLMPEHMKVIVPYTSELSIGRMSANDYKFVFADATGEKRYRGINVKQATAPGIDDFDYALITQGLVSEVYYKNDDVKITMTGVLNSTCTTLDEGIKIEKVDDVFVIMPMLKVNRNQMCAQVLRPFSREVNLGKLPMGHYLVHMRSMNGRSVNRVFQIVD